MRLSDITVFQSRKWGLSPFSIKVVPSNKTKYFLLKLINDSYFIVNLVELRKKYKIPKNGYPAKLLDDYKSKITYEGTPEEMKEFKLIK